MSAGLLSVEIAPSAFAQTSSTQLQMPSALAYDRAGNLYIADARRHQVFEATLAGTLVVVAGTGTQGFSGDGGPATSAELNSPQGLAFGGDGTLYIADTANARIRSVSNGVITTFAGTGVSGFGGEGGPADAASFRKPTALAVDAWGALLICDSADHRVRRLSQGVISTLAGTGVQGFSGDGQAATAAELDSPSGLAVGADQRVFIADSHNHRVRVVSADGTIHTFAGTGTAGFGGEGGPATAAPVFDPEGLATAPDGSVLIVDAGNQRVRSVSASGTIATIAGSGLEGGSADATSAFRAAFRSPRAIAYSPLGFPAVGDSLNGAVRVLISGQALYLPAAFAPGRVSSVQPVWAQAQMYGQVSGAVAVSGSIGVPQGTVSVLDAGSPLAGAALNTGSAVISLPAVGAGVHNFTLSYSGDGLNPAAAASTIVNVSPAPVVAMADSASVPYGSPLPPFTGQLAGVLPQDAGQVTAVFGLNGATAGAVGTYPISAALEGPKAANYAVALGPGSGTLRVTQAASKVALGSVAQSYAGLPLRLSATVSSTTSGQPTGTVQFLEGTTVVASAPLVNGSASAIYLSPTSGPLALSARYGGDVNFTASTSPSLTATISQMPDFLLGSPGASTAVVAAGAIATFQVQVQAEPAPFTGVVTFSATGLPAGATASFSPTQVIPGAGAANVTMTVQTSLPQALLRKGGVDTGELLAGFGLVFVACASKRRRRSMWLCAGTLWLCGCGARTVTEGTQSLISQSYALTVTATSTNLLGKVVTHTLPLSLTVQQ